MVSAPMWKSGAHQTSPSTAPMLTGQLSGSIGRVFSQRSNASERTAPPNAASRTLRSSPRSPRPSLRRVIHTQARLMNGLPRSTPWPRAMKSAMNLLLPTTFLFSSLWNAARLSISSRSKGQKNVSASLSTCSFSLIF